MVVVEVRQGAGGEETRRGDEERRRGEEEEEQATDIKSNNPHLAGGELTKKLNNYTGLKKYGSVQFERARIDGGDFWEI